MQAFMKNFIKDYYDHRYNEVDENELELLYIIKKRYIYKMPLLIEGRFILFNLISKMV